MKHVDDYSAKLEIWARARRVQAMPVPANLPRFGHKSFRSHREMNAWKKRYLGQIAELGGVKWECGSVGVCAH